MSRTWSLVRRPGEGPSSFSYQIEGSAALIGRQETLVASLASFAPCFADTVDVDGLDGRAVNVTQLVEVVFAFGSGDNFNLVAGETRDGDHRRDAFFGVVKVDEPDANLAILSDSVDRMRHQESGAEGSLFRWRASTN